MAFGRHLLRNFSSVVWRSTYIFKEPSHLSCVRLCIPSRMNSSPGVVNQNSLIKPADVLEGKPSEFRVEGQEKITFDVISNVNREIEDKSHGRLFAVIHVCGKQFKVTAEDLLVIEGYWPPNIGDKLKLKKVLLVGGCDFTLIGRPILPAGLASVDATVIEKTLSHTKTIFRKKRRKQFMRINFHRSEYTILRINSIDLTENVNVKKDVEGLESVF